MRERSRSNGGARGWARAAWAVIALGCAARFYAAWTLQYADMRDSSVVMLMAKHMAEGLAFPVFYYGQAYMGSFEPMVSALIVRLFGYTPFAVCAGTALLGCCSLALVYLLARDAGGPRAGFFAALFFLTSSDATLYLSAHPRGGYMTLLVFGLLTVLFANRFAARALSGRSPPATYLALCGLCAGIGWWNNQMIVAFFAAAGLILLPALPACFRRGAWWKALLAFAVGSLPWWLWNIRHDGASFSFAGTFGAADVRTGLSCLGYELPRVLGYKPWTEPINKARLAGLLVLAGVSLHALYAAGRRNGRRSLSFLAGLSAWALTLSMGLLYVHSHFALIRTPRYLLPVASGAAVIVGIAMDALGRARRRWILAGALPVFLLALSPTLYRLPAWAERIDRDRTHWQTANELADVLQATADGVAAGDFLLYWAQAANGERGILTPIPNDAYAPYARKAALAPRQAFVNDYRGVRSFLEQTQARWRETAVGGFHVLHTIEPPHAQWVYLPTHAIRDVRGGRSPASLKAVLHDEDLSTAHTVALDARNDETLTWTLDGPRALCGLTIMDTGDDGPLRVGIEGRLPSGAWTTLLPPHETTGFFWSGERIYHQGFDYHPIFRWSSPTGGLTGLRVTLSSDAPRTVRLPDMFLLEADPSVRVEECPAGEVADAWIERLQALPMARLYAPRRLAEQLRGRLTNGVRVRASSYLDRTVHQLAQTDSMRAPAIRLDVRTGFLTARRDAERTRRRLDGRRLAYKEWDHAGHTLFVVEPVDPDTRIETVLPLHWTACGLLAGDGLDDRFERATVLLRRARQTQAIADRLRLLERAIELAPDYEEAVGLYIEQLNASGDTQAAEAANARLEPSFNPPIDLRATFKGGIALVGVAIQPRIARPGETVEITYYWRFEPGAAIGRWSVFVHLLEGGERIAQDDHNLSEIWTRDDLRDQPYPRTFRVTRRVRIPPETQGRLELNIGLVNPLNGKRSPVKAPHVPRRRAVALPDAIEVR